MTPPHLKGKPSKSSLSNVCFPLAMSSPSSPTTHSTSHDNQYLISKTASSTENNRMFRRKESSIPKDFIFPTDLNGLGYYINDHDQIRMKDSPDKPFHYFCSKNERYVEMNKEAMSEIIRRIVLERLHQASMVCVNLPLGTPDTEPHVPILTSKNLATCKRVVVFFGESCQDLGILAGRRTSDGSINDGSAVSFVKHLLKDYKVKEAPGVVIANPGQLVWWRRGCKAISFQSWSAIPRRSAVAPGPMMTDKNKIPGNEDQAEHTACIFNEIVKPLITRGVKVDVIGVGDGAMEAVNFLDTNWKNFEKGMEAMINITSYVWMLGFESKGFKEWFGKYARVYTLSDLPFNTPLNGRPSTGCNVYSSKECFYVEVVMCDSYKGLLDYFKLFCASSYENLPQNLPEPKAWNESDSWGAPVVEWQEDEPFKAVEGHEDLMGDDGWRGDVDFEGKPNFEEVVDEEMEKKRYEKYGEEGDADKDHSAIASNADADPSCPF